MIYPSSALGTLRPDLAGSMEEFDLDMNQQGMIALRVAPAVTPAKKQGSFGVLPVEELLKAADTRRVPGGPYKRGTATKLEPRTFACEEHGWEEPVDEADADMYSEYIDAEMFATKRGRHQVMKNYEARVAALAAAVSNTSAAGTAWTSPSSATPIANVRTAGLAMRDRCGLMPNALICTYNRLQYLKDCAEIVDRLKYSGLYDPARGSVTAQMLAVVFDVEEIIVPGMMYNSANEGQAVTLASVWADNRAYVARIARTNDHKEPCWLRTFHYAGDGSQIGGVIEEYDEPQTRSKIIRCRFDTDELEMYADAVQGITGV